MSNARHTPGEWTLGEETMLDDGGAAVSINAPSWGELAKVVVRMEGAKVNIEEGEANARLIAAAPRMYAWLTAHYASEEGPGTTDRPEYAELRDILKSISGEQ